MNALPIDQFCTLPTVARPERLMEFEELLQRQDEPPQRIGPHLVEFSFAAAEGLYAEISDFVARESACCSFFNFVIDQRSRPRADQDQVVLRVGVPASRDDVLEALMDRAVAAAGQ